MANRRLLALVCSLLSIACGKDRDGSGGPPADTCPQIAASFRDALKSAGGACTTAADCACYNPVVADAGCGGVTDRATADALADLERRFHAAGCPWPHQCAAWVCNPACVEGRCSSS
jgi:hypothetical protein